MGRITEPTVRMGCTCQDHNGVSDGLNDQNNQILAVYRSTQGREKHRTNDTYLLDAIVDGLRARDYDVRSISEDLLPEFIRVRQPRFIISMAQDPANTAALASVQDYGGRVVNSFEGVLNTYRLMLSERLAQSTLPHPETRVIYLDELPDDLEFGSFYEHLVAQLGPGFWLKRGDIHANHDRDVIRVEEDESFALALADFVSRSVPAVIAQSHVQGDVVKFYAVRGDRFFHAQYFANEQPVEFETGWLRDRASEAANLLDLEFFGGDVVVDHRGVGPIIDLNAWPSFGTVRADVVPIMIDRIGELFSEHRAASNSFGE